MPFLRRTLVRLVHYWSFSAEPKPGPLKWMTSRIATLWGLESKMPWKNNHEPSVATGDAIYFIADLQKKTSINFTSYYKWTGYHFNWILCM